MKVLFFVMNNATEAFCFADGEFVTLAATKSQLRKVTEALSDSDCKVGVVNKESRKFYVFEDVLHRGGTYSKLLVSMGFGVQVKAAPNVTISGTVHASRTIQVVCIDFEVMSLNLIYFFYV